MAIVVKGIDNAQDFYTKKLGLKNVTDNDVGNGYRRVTVTPPGIAHVISAPDVDLYMTARFVPALR